MSRVVRVRTRREAKKIKGAYKRMGAKWMTARLYRKVKSER